MSSGCFELVTNVGDITLWRNRNDGSLILEAGDPFYTGNITEEIAKEMMHAFVIAFGEDVLKRGDRNGTA